MTVFLGRLARLKGAKSHKRPPYIFGGLTIHYLVVGGGGGASQGGAGGGGARSSWTANSSQTGGGGSAEAPAAVRSGELCTVTVGAGQAGREVFSNSGIDGTLSSSFVCITKDTNCFFGGGSGAGGGCRGSCR